MKIDDDYEGKGALRRREIFLLWERNTMIATKRRMMALITLMSVSFMNASSNGIDVNSRSFFTVRPHLNDFYRTAGNNVLILRH